MRLSHSSISLCSTLPLYYFIYYFLFFIFALAWAMKMVYLGLILGVSVGPFLGRRHSRLQVKVKNSGQTLQRDRHACLRCDVRMRNVD